MVVAQQLTGGAGGTGLCGLSGDRQRSLCADKGNFAVYLKLRTGSEFVLSPHFSVNDLDVSVLFQALQVFILGRDVRQFAFYFSPLPLLSQLSPFLSCLLSAAADDSGNCLDLRGHTFHSRA